MLILRLLLFTFLHVALAHGAGPAPVLTDAWRALAEGLFSDANELFSAARAAHPGDRAAQLGEALSLLQLQPHTNSRVQRGVNMLEALLAEDTADEIGVRARYFRARAEHVHRLSPTPLAAASHYERVISEHPAHPLAGQATVKLALIRLYRMQTPVELAFEFSGFTERASTLPSAAARRDLHLILGEAALRLDLGEAAALDHFLAALDVGIELRPMRADTLVRVGELAAELSRPDIARAHYAAFMEEFPRDPRFLAVSERHAALPSPATP